MLKLKPCSLFIIRFTCSAFLAFSSCFCFSFSFFSFSFAVFSSLAFELELELLFEEECLWDDEDDDLLLELLWLLLVVALWVLGVVLRVLLLDFFGSSLDLDLEDSFLAGDSFFLIGSPNRFLNVSGFLDLSFESWTSLLLVLLLVVGVLSLVSLDFDLLEEWWLLL